MTVNPYTMNNLYNKGIIDYVPFDLTNGAFVSGMNGMQNPYLANAMQGNLYQQYGNQRDGFYSSNNYGNSNTGVQTKAGLNSYGQSGIGSLGQAGMNSFGVSGIGYNSSCGMDSSCGGFGDVRQNLNRTASLWSRIPNPVKGLMSLGLIIGSCAFILKGKKAPVTEATKTSFLAN